MLNFTQLANQFADTYTPPVSRAPGTTHKKTEYGFLQRTLDTYGAAMQGKDWQTTERIAGKVGTDKFTANGVLKRMAKAGLVEWDDTKKNARGRPLYLWRWL